MYRPNTESDYIPVSYADQVFNENLIFNDYAFQDGYYCIGYSSTPMSLSIKDNLLSGVSVYPNPANNTINIKKRREFHYKPLQYHR